MLRCPKEAFDKCLYSRLCELGCPVEEGSDCAEFIRAVLADQQQPGGADPVEAEYIRQEREAIQTEAMPGFMRKYIDKSRQ